MIRGSGIARIERADIYHPVAEGPDLVAAVGATPAMAVTLQMNIRPISSHNMIPHGFKTLRSRFDKHLDVRAFTTTTAQE